MLSTHLTQPHLILLIDDDESMYTLISTLYTKYRFRWFDNGTDGLHAIRAYSKTASLVILDYEMKNGLNGFAVLEDTRRNLPNIPILMWSGSHSIKQEALEKGASAFLEKPFDPNELESTISTLISQKNNS